jgi:hypothetical protein
VIYLEKDIPGDNPFSQVWDVDYPIAPASTRSEPMEPGIYRFQIWGCGLPPVKLDEQWGVEFPEGGSIHWGVSGPQTPSQMATLVLHNQTGHTICEVYFRPSGESIWGANRLPDPQLVPDGHTRTWTIEPGFYDLKAVDCQQNVVDTTYDRGIGNIEVTYPCHWYAH